MAGEASIFVTRMREEIPDNATKMMESKYKVTYWTEPGPITRAGLLEGVVGVDALYCILTDKIDKDVLDRADNLKVISTMSVGLDHLDLETIKAKNIRVGYNPDVLTDAVADLTVGLLLATSRRLLEGNSALKSGDWGAWHPLWLCGPQLKGSTVGIVGLGRIGRAVVKRLKPFGVKEFLYSGRTKKEESDEEGAVFSTFENLLKESDFVILTLAYTPESKDLFDEKAFKLMKKSSILINPSRGAVINQDHLVTALKDGSIFGAGLDVMTPEPLPIDHPLTSLPNCTLVPHLGSATIETRALMGVMTVENITGVLENTKMPAEFII